MLLLLTHHSRLWRDKRVGESKMMVSCESFGNLIWELWLIEGWQRENHSMVVMDQTNRSKWSVIIHNPCTLFPGYSCKQEHRLHFAKMEPDISPTLQQTQNLRFNYFCFPAYLIWCSSQIGFVYKQPLIWKKDKYVWFDIEQSSIWQVLCRNQIEE